MTSPAQAGDGRPALGMREVAAASLARLRGGPGLRRSLWWWLGSGLLLTEAFAVGVAQLQSQQAAAVAALGALAWWLVVSLVPVLGACLLRTPDGLEVDRLGVPNGLTLLRAYSCAGLILCAFVSTPHRIGFILWATVGAAAALLDLLDGYIARHVGPLTALGQTLDPVMDCAFFSMAAVGNIALGIVPWWLGAILLARYAGPLVFGLAYQIAGRRPELSATTWGKRNTLLTGTTLAVLLVVRSLDGPTELIAVPFAIPLAATTLLHFGVLAQRERVAARATAGASR